MSDRSLDLLSIDVDAEVRKLCGQQFRNRGELLLEVIRMFIVENATQIDIAFTRRSTTLVCRGAALTPEAREHLLTIKNGSLPSEARHAALLRCESRFGPGLLGILGEEQLRLRHDGEELAFSAGGAARRSAPVSADRIELVMSALPPAERKVVAEGCQYARVPIHIGRRAVGGQLPNSVLVSRTAEHDGLEVWVGITSERDICQTVYLWGEVVARETFGVSPSGFTHVAIVRDHTARRNDDVRAEAAYRLVKGLRGQLYEDMKKRFAGSAESDRGAIRELLLRLAERSQSDGPIEALALFPRVQGGPVDIAALRHTSRRGSIWAVAPNPRGRSWPVSAEAIFVLDARLRIFVAGHTHFSIVEPPSVGEPSRWSRIVRAGRKLVRRFSDWLLGRALLGVVIPNEQLEPLTVSLLAAIQRGISTGRYRLPNVPAVAQTNVVLEVLSRGRLPAKPIRRRGGWVVRLPRGALGYLASRHAADQYDLYPILAVIFGGHDGFGLGKAPLQQQLIDGDAH